MPRDLRGDCPLDVQLGAKIARGMTDDKVQTANKASSFEDKPVSVQKWIVDDLFLALLQPINRNRNELTEQILRFEKR